MFNNYDLLQLLATCTAELKKLYSNVNVLDQKYLNFLNDEIDWIKSCNYTELECKSNSLSKNYRTTTQIAEATYSLIENDPNITEDDNFVKAKLKIGKVAILFIKAFELLSKR